MLVIIRASCEPASFGSDKMSLLSAKSIGCPYCGETIKVLIEPADLNQQYIEDCQVCCKPITFMVFEHDNGEFDVNVYSEDDAF